MYQPNRLLTSPIHKCIVDALKENAEIELLLRPTRRFLFHTLYRPSVYVPEFNKPCLGVLCARSDLEKRPLMVIETESQLTEALRHCYRECEISWLEVFEGLGGIHIVGEHLGIRMELTTPIAYVGIALKAPQAWVSEVRERSFIPQGRLIQSFHERVLREAIDRLTARFPIECHHQMPFGFVAGYRAQMPPQIARSAVDAVLLFSTRFNSDGVVLLPINLNLHNAHVANEQTAEKDRLINQFAQEIEMPLLTIRAAEQPDAYIFSAVALDIKPITVIGRSPEDWAQAICPFVEAVIERLN